MSGVALITGGHTGIGFGVAKALDAAGFGVALASLPSEDAPDVRAALEALGGRARYHRLDVQDLDAQKTVLDRVEATQGPITTLISNAGVSTKVRGDLLDLGADSFDSVLGVNLRGAFFLAQAVARRMIESPRDAYCSIQFVTSVSAEIASIERGDYCVSKAGAAMAAQLFAVRLAPHGVGVFDLRPGIIETGMTAGVKDKYSARIADGLVPARRWGTPDDIGSVAVALAEGRLAFAQGATIPVDGGLSIPRL